MAEEVTAVEEEEKDSPESVEAVETEEVVIESKIELSDKPFSDFGLSAELCESLKAQGFERPTTVQAEAMEPMLARRTWSFNPRRAAARRLRLAYRCWSVIRVANLNLRNQEQSSSRQRVSLRTRYPQNSVSSVNLWACVYLRSTEAYRSAAKSRS